MDTERLLAAVRNDRIEFASMRPPGSFLRAQRRVKVVAPPEAVDLAGRGELPILDALVALLAQPDRAWAAEVMLAAMTGREADIVDTFAQTPERWWESLGDGAAGRWSEWLREARGKLAWDPDARQFREVEPAR